MRALQCALEEAQADNSGHFHVVIADDNMHYRYASMLAHPVCKIH